MTTLYTKDAAGRIRFWDIDHNGEEIEIQYGMLGGEVQTKYEYVDEGKQGRDIDEQLDSRVGSRINKKLDAGYVYNVRDLEKGVRNAIGLRKPMLAKKMEGRVKFPCKVQHKYDGHRCLVKKNVSHIVAYSRNGKVLNNIVHILDDLMCITGLNNLTFDGELYRHGWSLQKISSCVKRRQPGSEEIQYIIYDVMMDIPYQKRYEILHTLEWGIDELDLKNIVVAETLTAQNDEDIYRMFAKSRSLGYEGSIVRHSDKGYEDGKRSTSLLKVKKRFDTECMVIGIKPSADGWAILSCLYNGKEFAVSAPGSMQEKYKVMKDHSDYLGQYVKVEFPNLTEGGVPFHPVAMSWLSDISID